VSLRGLRGIPLKSSENSFYLKKVRKGRSPQKPRLSQTPNKDSPPCSNFVELATLEHLPKNPPQKKRVLTEKPLKPVKEI